MNNELLASLKTKLAEIEKMASRVDSAERAVSSFNAMTKHKDSVSVGIGNLGNSCGMVRINYVDDTMIAIVRCAFVAHLEGLKAEYKKMNILIGE